MSVCVDDMNWNALEWDRAAEELTWERVNPHFIIDRHTIYRHIFYLCYAALTMQHLK